MGNFIKCFDDETAKSLTAQGLKLVFTNGKEYVYEVKDVSNLVFDKKKVILTNKLFF